MEAWGGLEFTEEGVRSLAPTSTLHCQTTTASRLFREGELPSGEN